MIGNEWYKDMNHKRIQNQLSAYLDDELTPVMQAQVEEHLLVCSECRDMLSAFQKNRRQFASLVHPAPPIKDAVMAHIRAQTAPAATDGFSRFEWLTGSLRRTARYLIDCTKAACGTRPWYFRPLTAGATGVLTLALLLGFLYFYPTTPHYEDALDVYFGIHTEQISGNPLKSNVGMPLISTPVSTLDTVDDTELFLDLYLGD